MQVSDTTSETSNVEFIALTAMMFAIVAFSVDAMLPAMPHVATDLGLSNPQHAPLILTAFLIGMGCATFVAGPISDAVGRRPAVFGGLLIFALGAFLSWRAQSFEGMIAARFLQGVGAAGPRVACLAIVRDRFAGAEMARIMSLASVLFLMVPAFAPIIGAMIIRFVDWHNIYALFVIYAAILAVWFGSRQTETLHAEDRRPISPAQLLRTLKEILRHPTTRMSVMIQTLLMALLFSVVTMVQPIFDITFGRADSFPYWFGALALISSAASFANARLVIRFGMRNLISVALWLQFALTSAAILLFLVGAPGQFWIYLVWQLGAMAQVGLTNANLNSLALEPMGHVAGATSSVIGSFSIFGGAVMASVAAPLFDGTPVPLFMIALILVVASRFLLSAMLRKEASLA